MTFTAQADEGPREQTWTGALGADDLLKGTIDVQQGLATGEFTPTPASPSRSPTTKL